MDFLNKEKLTHIIIFIFILLSLTYLYNMNSNTKDTTKTITENFMILTEDQDLEANNVMINNLTQVNFKAGANDNMTINFADPTTEWPVNLQQLFDSKLDNNGVVGTFVAGNTPLQGIILNDLAGKQLVKLGDNIPFGPPTTATTINDKCIQFGGINNDRNDTSASIFINRGGNFSNNDLCIVGMTNGKDWNTSRISMWATAGLNIYGPTSIGGALSVTGAGTIGGALSVTSTGTFGSSLSCVTNLKMTGSGNSGIGGAIQIVNTDKTGNTEAFVWNIYNMRNYGSTNTSGPGKTGSGLSFWRYCQAGCGSGLCNVHMTLNDDGSTYFASDINVAGELGVATTIRKTRANGANLHVVSDKNLFLMAKDNVYIYKCTSDCAAWDNSSGNLIVEGNCSVKGSLYITDTVKMGNTSCWSPIAQTCITEIGIQFGGANNGREYNSAQITAGRHIADSLNIVGMSDANHQNRRVDIWAEGGCRIYGPLWCDYGNRVSDIRLKENIKNISQNDKDKVLQLESKTYNMIKDEKKSKRYGLIAQDVEKLFPEIVHETPDGMKGLCYEELIPLLIEHIKDLKKTIPNPNVINIGGVTLTGAELYKLKQLLN